MKRIAVFLIVGIFILSAASVLAAETTTERLNKGLNDMLYGPVEGPDNISETKTKGAKVSDDCIDKTKTGVERAIARTFAGVWKVATFWYADTTYKTSQKNPTK